MLLCEVTFPAGQLCPLCSLQLQKQQALLSRTQSQPHTCASYSDASTQPSRQVTEAEHTRVFLCGKNGELEIKSLTLRSYHQRRWWRKQRDHNLHIFLPKISSKLCTPFPSPYPKNSPSPLTCPTFWVGITGWQGSLYLVPFTLKETLISILQILSLSGSVLCTLIWPILEQVLVLYLHIQ